jgi:chemotaxis protein methyltransferase CheR
MTREEFDFIVRLIHERSGVVLTRDKTYLLENRLAPILRRRQMRSLSELIAALPKDAELAGEVIDAMMAKDTGFFRDWKPFVHFRDVVLPNVLAARGAGRSLRILSAGASTGQEAYSLAIAIRENARFRDWHVEVVGIDLSPSAILAAERAHYSQFDVQRGLPIQALMRYFAKTPEGLWALDEPTRRMVRFKVWNLRDELFPLGRFDVILCRNVLVYFDLQSKLYLLQKFARILAEDGVFYLGHDETITGLSNAFHPAVPALSIYAANRPERTSQSLADETSI